jgi:hypothetical protein
VHLKPWEHYVPAEIPNLGLLKDWLFEESTQNTTRQIAENGSRLFKTRLRPAATYCYLARLMQSLASVQETPPSPALLEALNLPLHKWVPFSEYDQFSG